MTAFDIVLLVLCIVGLLCVIISFLIKDKANDKGAAANRSLNDMSKIAIAKTSDRMEALVKSAEEEFQSFVQEKTEAAVKQLEEAGKSDNRDARGTTKAKKAVQEAFADEPTSEIAADELENLGEAEKQAETEEASEIAEEVVAEASAEQKNLSSDRDNGRNRNSKGKNGKNSKNKKRQYDWGEALAIASADEKEESEN